jgi:hypothetical protein
MTKNILATNIEATAESRINADLEMLKADSCSCGDNCCGGAESATPAKVAEEALAGYGSLVYHVGKPSK